MELFELVQETDANAPVFGVVGDTCMIFDR
jgi:hypothetical protein